MRVLIVLLTVLSLFACKLQREHSKQKWGRAAKGALKSADEVAELVAKAMKQNDIDGLRALVKGVNSVAAIKALQADIVGKFTRVDSLMDEFAALKKGILARNPAVTDVTSTSPLAKRALDDVDQALDELLDGYDSHLTLTYRIITGDETDVVLLHKIIVNSDEAQLAKWEGIVGKQRAEMLEKIARVRNNIRMDIIDHLISRNFEEVESMMETYKDDRVFLAVFNSFAHAHKGTIVDLMLRFNTRGRMLDVEKTIGKLATINSGQQAAEVINEFTDNIRLLFMNKQLVERNFKPILDNELYDRVSRALDNTLISESSYTRKGEMVFQEFNDPLNRWTEGLKDAAQRWEITSDNIYRYGDKRYSVSELINIRLKSYQDAIESGLISKGSFDRVSEHGWNVQSKR